MSAKESAQRIRSADTLYISVADRVCLSPRVEMPVRPLVQVYRYVEPILAKVSVFLIKAWPRAPTSFGHRLHILNPI